MDIPDLSGITGFDWSRGNAQKVSRTHSVLPAECEEIFFHEPVIVGADPLHSDREDRYFVLGRTGLYRLLFVVFTLRKGKIRVISARDMTKREKTIYEAHLKENPQIQI